MICEKFAKGEYKFEPLEDNHVFDYEILKILKDTCKDDEMIFEIAKGLLEIELFDKCSSVILFILFICSLKRYYFPYFISK